MRDAAADELVGFSAAFARHLRWQRALLRSLSSPAGAPHAVTNLTHTTAVSANFVEASHVDGCREELAVAAAHSPEAARLLEQLSSPAFPAEMDLGVGHLPWREFKRADRRPCEGAST